MYNDSKQNCTESKTHNKRIGKKPEDQLEGNACILKHVKMFYIKKEQEAQTSFKMNIHKHYLFQPPVFRLLIIKISMQHSTICPNSHCRTCTLFICS